jgi:hypothetical protein
VNLNPPNSWASLPKDEPDGLPRSVNIPPVPIGIMDPAPLGSPLAMMLRILGRVAERCENEQEERSVMTTREAVAQLSGRFEDYSPQISALLHRILRATC